MEKKLYRSKTNRQFSGVCGGLGEYLNIDPTLVRVFYVVISLCAGVGVLGLILYFVLAQIIPEAPEGFDGGQNAQ
ncbi:MAG: PspC domain-containing protein [Oscillospiraceae bacterium]|jgi:phage shock protein C|nr:PspC domain-containing protein [Oscillospiraceae bacterium]